MDEIGVFRGKPISSMTRDELIGFARWVALELGRLSKVARDTQEFRLEKEIIEKLNPR